jgi:hypothetical protein
MSKRFLGIAAVVLIAVVAHAYLGQVVSSFRSPAGSNTRGLGRGGPYLYVMNGNTRATVYRTRPVTGSIIDWFMVPWAGENSGLAFSAPSYLWVGRVDNDRVYRVQENTGSVYFSWNAGHDPYGLAPWCTGDGGTGTSYLFSTDDAPSRLYTHQLSNGSIVNSNSLLYNTRCDCAYDWRNNLVWIGQGGSIYAVAPSGAPVASFSSPAGSPRGLTYTNSYLWIACNSNGFIYRVHCPKNFTAVTPASLGKVRAIFR